MKKLTFVLVLLLVALSLAPCYFKKTKTESKTETKPDGSSVTETISETKENGVYTSETVRTFYRKSVPWSFVNDTDFSWAELYIAVGESEEWGENLMEEGSFINVGETASGLTVSFTQDTAFNVRVGDGNGFTVDFTGINLSFFEEAESITMSIAVKEDGSYSLFY